MPQPKAPQKDRKSTNFRPQYVPSPRSGEVFDLNDLTNIRAAIPTGRMIRVTFEVDEVHAPALRSAVDEISQEIGGRLEGPSSYAREAALTNAAVCIGTLRRAVNAVVPKGDPDYEHR